MPCDVHFVQRLRGDLCRVNKFPGLAIARERNDVRFLRESPLYHCFNPLSMPSPIAFSRRLAKQSVKTASSLISPNMTWTSLRVVGPSCDEDVDESDMVDTVHES